MLDEPPLIASTLGDADLMSQRLRKSAVSFAA
jgi:hypothetical protein